MSALHAHLIIRDVPKALAWYEQALGAVETQRYVDHQRGVVVFAEMKIGDAAVSMAEENREWHNHAPPSLNGSPVLLTLQVDDARAVGQRMIDHGARVVFPIEDQFYGERSGRLADPFGHLWMIRQMIEELTPEEIQRRVDNFKG